MANSWFTSDSHFGHENIIKYVKRPFANANEADEFMIQEWNKRVKPEDTIYHNGDFCLGVPDKFKYSQNIIRRLNGNIEFLMGNHDPENWLSKNVNPGFRSIGQYREIKVNGQSIVLFHYALRTWRHDLRGTWHLYGHSHAALPGYGKSFDVGVDAWKFSPVHFDEIKQKMDKLEIGDHPKFSEFNDPPKE